MKESLHNFLWADKGGKGKQKKGDSTCEWVVEQLQHPKALIKSQRCKFLCFFIWLCIWNWITKKYSKMLRQNKGEKEYGLWIFLLEGWVYTWLFKLGEKLISRFCRELTYWSPIGRETNFGRLESCKERRVLSPCHSISSQSLDKSATSELQTLRSWSALRYHMPWGRGHFIRYRVQREMRFQRYSFSKASSISVYTCNLIWREGQQL